MVEKFLGGRFKKWDGQVGGVKSGCGENWEGSKVDVVHSEHYSECHESFNFFYWKMRLGSLPS